jgi:hypothetical protein
MSFDKKQLVGAGVCVVAAVIGVTFLTLNSTSRAIHKDLKEAARSGRATGFLKNFDLFASTTTPRMCAENSWRTQSVPSNPSLRHLGFVA